VLAAQESAEGIHFKVVAHVGAVVSSRRFRCQMAAQLTSTSSWPKWVKVCSTRLRVAVSSARSAARQWPGAALLKVVNGLGGLASGVVVMDRDPVTALGQGVGDVPTEAVLAAAGDQGDTG